METHQNIDWTHLLVWNQSGDSSPYLYSSSCSLTAETMTVGTSAKIKTKKKEEEEEGELVVGMNQRPFVCCNESWDMKADKSSRGRGKHSLSVSHTREGGKVELVDDLRGSHTSKDRTGRWWRGGPHAGEGPNRARRDFAETFRKQNIKAKCTEVGSRLL